MRMRFVVVMVAIGLTGVGGAFGQSGSLLPVTAAAPGAATAAVAFEVASVRPAAAIDQATIFAGLRAGRRPESMHIETDRATFKYMSLKQLAAYAYKVRAYQVSGPDWMTTDRFDIAAKLPDGASKDDVPAMMQALLADRFKLAAHLETKERPVIGLMLAKGGSSNGSSSKMKEVSAAPPLDESAALKPGETKVDSIEGTTILSSNADGSTTYRMGARGTMTIRVDGDTGKLHLEGEAMTMDGLAARLTTLGGGNGRQVVDLTALKGNYDFAVEFSLAELVGSLRESGIDVPVRQSGGGGPSVAADPGADATVADALGRLGLKLQPTKAPVEQLVIDHVEKTATEN
ncbi:MAG TPA: TIGR03435 family protein [Acidobacteriaceae bacterium]|nr:TIGR03435 family protein [Acidobacteriaceae bacterium]